MISKREYLKYKAEVDSLEDILVKLRINKRLRLV